MSSRLRAFCLIVGCIMSDESECNKYVLDQYVFK